MNLDKIDLNKMSVEGLDKNIFAISEALVNARSAQSIIALKKILENLQEVRKEVKRREIDSLKFRKDKWKD